MNRRGFPAAFSPAACAVEMAGRTWGGSGGRAQTGVSRRRTSLRLRSAGAAARTVSNPARNAKLSKGSHGGRRLPGRDDAACAAILTVAEGARRYQKRPERVRPLCTSRSGVKRLRQPYDRQGVTCQPCLALPSLCLALPLPALPNDAKSFRAEPG